MACGIGYLIYYCYYYYSTPYSVDDVKWWRKTFDLELRKTLDLLTRVEQNQGEREYYPFALPQPTNRGFLPIERSSCEATWWPRKT